jgi:uncharacterized protein YbbK (DUF523 family)
MKLLCSACLLGKNCRYDGKNNENKKIKKLFYEHEVIPICPEELGDLPTPRPPAEIKCGKVITNKGVDVTKNFNIGAYRVLEIAKKLDIKNAILKQRSPSCGCGKIYDGTFTKTVIEGNGITAKMLIDNGIEVGTEENYL